MSGLEGIANIVEKARDGLAKIFSPSRIAFTALRVSICSLGLVAPSLVFAADAPFRWPESYAITYSQTGYGTPLLNTYTKDGPKARNDVLGANKRLDTTIFLLNEHKMISIANGITHESALSFKYPSGDPFPTVGSWEFLGTDTLKGSPALKYKVSNDPARHDPSKPMSYFFLWLSADKKIPLRMEEAGMIREFSRYVPGPQDPKLFSAPDNTEEH